MSEYDLSFASDRNSCMGELYRDVKRMKKDIAIIKEVIEMGKKKSKKNVKKSSGYKS